MSVRRRTSGRVHYNYFRDYDPAVGRYVESDPVGLKGGLNTYLYAQGQPQQSTDPKGLNVATGARWGGNIGGAIGGFFGPAGVWGGRIIGAGIGAWIGYKLVEDAANDEEVCPECKLLSARASAAEGHHDSDGVIHTGLNIWCTYGCPDGAIIIRRHFIAPELAPLFLSDPTRVKRFCPATIKQY